MKKKEIVEKKKEDLVIDVSDMFKSINTYFDAQKKRMEEFTKRVFYFPEFDVISTIESTNVEDFKKSIEEFQKNNPTAKVKASAYAYSTGREPQMFTYETQKETPKLEEKKKSKKRSKKQ